MPSPTSSTLPPASSGSARASVTAQRILDAAEAAFAAHGYFGATIREITNAAGVPLSQARYHFGSKDDLFMQVLSRRATQTCDQLDASLAQALASPGGNPLEAVVAAMVAVPVERLASGDLGWRHYLQLLAQMGQLLGRPELLEPFRAPYTKTLSRYRKALRAALPGAPANTVAWGLHFLQTLVGFAILNLDATRWIGGDTETTTRWQDLQRHLVTHVVGGLQAQVALAGAAPARRRGPRKAR